MDEYLKTILAWKLLTQKTAIDKQREKNIQLEKEVREYWEWKNRGGDDE